MKLTTAKILKELQPLADAEYRDSVDYFSPQDPAHSGVVWKSVGVRVPALREFEKPYFKQLKSADDYRMMVKFTDEGFDTHIRELAVFGLEALMKLKKHWQPDLLKYVLRWVDLLSGWEMTDITSGLLSEMLFREIITLDDIYDLKDHPSVWGRRILIVSLIYPMRKGKGDIDRYLEVLALFKDSREKMIIKAVSWILREGSKSNPNKIRAFIDKYESDLHSSVLREVRNKLDKGLKNPK